MVLFASVVPTLQREHVQNQSGGCESITRTTDAILVVILSTDKSTTKVHDRNPRNADTTEANNTTEKTNTNESINCPISEKDSDGELRKTWGTEKDGEPHKDGDPHTGVQRGREGGK